MKTEITPILTLKINLIRTNASKLILQEFRTL